MTTTADLTTERAALDSEKQRLADAIAALAPDLGRPMPGRKIPSSASAKHAMLTRQLATVNLKIKQNDALRTKAAG